MIILGLGLGMGQVYLSEPIFVWNWAQTIVILNNDITNWAQTIV